MSNFYEHIDRRDPDAKLRLWIEIAKGKGKGYKLVVKERSAILGAEVSLTPLGNSIEAMKEYIKLIPLAYKIEDTTVRWEEGTDIYPANLMNEFRNALMANESLEFQSITGPIIDDNYSRALASAYEHRREAFKGFRLRRTSPLMNFTIFYLRDGDKERKRCFFGYGKHSGLDFSMVRKTAVFASDNKELLVEYQRLFNLLSGGMFSKRIDIDDPEFTKLRVYKSDVVATFEKWPEEIAERIEHCSDQVTVCVAGWSQLDTHLDALKTALDNRRSVTIALWEPTGNFVSGRSRTTRTPIVKTINENLASLCPLLAEYKTLRVLGCQGWGSASIFWIDDRVYFGLYWLKGTLLGPFFLIDKDSPTGGYLLEEFKAMSKNAIEICKVPVS